MADNLLTNAGFLDLETGWWTSAGMSLSVDENLRGAAGRAVLRAVGTASAAGQERWLAASPRADITSVPLVEAMLSVAGFVGGASVRPQVFVSFFDEDDERLAAYPVSLSPPHLPHHGIARDGLADTYWNGYGLFIRPSNAVTVTFEIGVTSTAASQQLELCLLKPWTGAPSPLKRKPVWSPGDHASVDLQRACWPSDLRLEGREGAQSKPFAVVHDAGVGRPVTRRSSADPARKMTARVRCNTVQRHALECFVRDNASWWMLEPDSERLCLASLDAEGAPRLVQHQGGLHIMELTIWLETA